MSADLESRLVQRWLRSAGNDQSAASIAFDLNIPVRQAQRIIKAAKDADPSLERRRLQLAYPGIGWLSDNRLAPLLGYSVQGIAQARQRNGIEPGSLLPLLTVGPFVAEVPAAVSRVLAHCEDPAAVAVELLNGGG